MQWLTVTQEPNGLGESPFWHPLEKRLYWCDIAGLSVNAWEPGTGRTWQWKTPSEPGCCARDQHDAGDLPQCQSRDLSLPCPQ